MQSLEELIIATCEAYGIPDRIKETALARDSRALKAIATCVCSRQAKIRPLDIYEISSWGANWSMSRHPELRKFQGSNRSSR